MLRFLCFLSFFFKLVLLAKGVRRASPPGGEALGGKLNTRRRVSGTISATAYKKGGSNFDRFSDTAAPIFAGCWISLQHEELNFLKVYHYTTFSWNIFITVDIVLTDCDVLF